MTIHNLDAYVSSLPDWAILDGCFPRDIKPTDIDGCVEIGGRALFLEHKSVPHLPVKKGQDILFKALATAGHAAIVYWTRDGEVVRMRKYWRGKSEEAPATLKDLRTSVKKWSDTANGNRNDF